MPSDRAAAYMARAMLEVSAPVVLALASLMRNE